MPQTAIPMTIALPKRCKLPRRLNASHKATVAATTAITREAANRVVS